MKVKVVNAEDIRVWRYNDKYNYDELNAFISSTWNIIYGEYIIQFEDDENDLMTIASAIDLKDAFDCAQSENKKSLKIYIQRTVKNKGVAIPAMHAKCDSFGEMALDFLKNAEIKKVLAQLFGVLIARIINSNISDVQYRKYAKYRKLRKIGVPQQSIINRMKLDGFTPNEINIFIENKFQTKQKIAAKYAKFIKLQKIKMPQQSIANKMKFDGFSETEIIFFFAETQTKRKRLKIAEIINFLNEIIKNSVITQHELYAKYGDILIAYIAEKIFHQQSVYQHFKFHTLQTWMKKVMGILCENMLENGKKDFNAIRNMTESHVAFPSDTDYGEAIHFGIGCNECECDPIIGERYKCSVCLDVNFCVKCQRNHNERHPLMQFKKSVVFTEEKGADSCDECDGNNIKCICGKKMESVVAKRAYNWTDIVFCDFCDKKYVNEMVYHCPNGRHTMHAWGYDVCGDCVSKHF